VSSAPPREESSLPGEGMCRSSHKTRHRDAEPTSHLRLVKGNPVRASALLDRALRWWRGPAYGEFADGFAGPAAARLEGLRISALEDRTALFVQSGAATEATATARGVMAREPLRERPVELLMRALHIDGRVGEALEVFREFRELLADELGLDPGPQLRDLQTQILQDGSAPHGCSGHRSCWQRPPAAAQGPTCPPSSPPSSAGSRR